MAKKTKSLRQEAYQEPASDQYFYLSDGRALKNLAELIQELKQMDEAVFRTHVDEGKNDFANWVRDVFGKEELASKIFRAKSKTGLARVLSSQMTS